MTGKLGDGVADIQFNYWDWGKEEVGVFTKGTVVDLRAKIDEYMGAKQLNIITMNPSSVPATEFAPKGVFDFVEYKELAKGLIAAIKNEKLKDIVRKCFNDNKELWDVAPAAKGIHHAFIAGNLKHSVDVAMKARVLAALVPGANQDLCVAGGLLQDLGKLWTYEFNEAIIDMTLPGQLIEHIAIGIAKLEQYRTPENTKIMDVLQHIVSSHHSRLEYGSPTTPQCLEAWIVAYADGLDSKVQTLLEYAAKASSDAIQTERIFTLENRSQLLPSYIESIMK